MLAIESSEGERKAKKVRIGNLHQERSEVPDDKLLPNMCNDITLKAICGKLPWEAFSNLSLVSPAWSQAIGSGQVYAARAASHSADIFAVVNLTLSEDFFGLSLYSLGDHPKCSETLPPIPGIQTGIPQSCECTVLDGKLYILGGLKDQTTQLSSDNVYMMSLQGGPRCWRVCASMHSPRQKFRAGIMNGKIYVCGGSSRGTPVCGTEVYDPDSNAWTPLMPMPFPRTGHDAAVVDGELFVYGGSILNPNFPADMSEQNSKYAANDIDVYNPVQDEWRRVHVAVPAEAYDSEQSSDTSQFAERRSVLLFVAHGRLLAMTRTNIFAFQFLTGTWTRHLSISSGVRLEVSTPIVDPNNIRSIQVVDDSMLAICGPSYQISLPESVGFLRLKIQGIDGPHEAEVDRDAVYWESVDCDVSVKGLLSPFIRVIHL